VGPQKPITPYQKKGPSRSVETSKDGAFGGHLPFPICQIIHYLPKIPHIHVSIPRCQIPEYPLATPCLLQHHQGSLPYSPTIIHGLHNFTHHQILLWAIHKKSIIEMQIDVILEPAPAHYVIIVQLYTLILANIEQSSFQGQRGTRWYRRHGWSSFWLFPQWIYLAVHEKDNCMLQGGSRGCFEWGSRAAEK